MTRRLSRIFAANWSNTRAHLYIEEKGFPASHLNIKWRDMAKSHFHDERIGEEWVITDLAEQLLVSSKQNHK